MHTLMKVILFALSVYAVFNIYKIGKGNGYQDGYKSGYEEGEASGKRAGRIQCVFERMK